MKHFLKNSSLCIVGIFFLSQSLVFCTDDKKSEESVDNTNSTTYLSQNSGSSSSAASNDNYAKSAEYNTEILSNASITNKDLTDSSDEKQKQFTVVSCNYAGIQNNPFEFEGLANGTDNVSNYEKILKEVKTKMDNEYLTEYIDENELKSLEIPNGEYENMNVYQFLTKSSYKNFSRIDKVFRSNNLERYSITVNRTDGKGNFLPFKAEDKLNGNNHLVNWEDSYENANKKVKILEDKELNKKLPGKDKQKKAKIGLEIFDVVTIRILERLKGGDDAGMLKIADAIAKGFYEGPVGDNNKKCERLLEIFNEKNADIVCIQEAGQEIIDKLKNNNYEVLGRSPASVIAINKDKLKFDVAQDFLLNKLREKLNKYYGEVVVALAKVKDTRRKVIIVAAHSSKDGGNSMQIIEDIMTDVDNHIELQNLPIVICHDANTSEKNKPGKKAYLYDYLGKLKEYELVKCVVDKVTTKKTRTYLQTQISRTETASDKSDVNSYRGLNDVTPLEVKAPGPNSDNPTDHSILGMTFSF